MKDIAGLTELLNEMKLSSEREEMVYQLVYSQLRTIAANVIRGARVADISPTDLLHTVYLNRLREVNTLFNNRQHFFALAARAMRQGLVDEIRARKSQKRRLPEHATMISGLLAGSLCANPEQYAFVQPMLEELELFDPTAGRVVELRLIFGFTIEETAAILQCSPRKVRDDWDFAIEWMKHRI